MTAQSVFETFINVQGGTKFGFLTILALVVILICIKKEYKKYLAASLGLVLVLCFNEVSYKILSKLGGADTYYRFFWIFPMALLLAVSICMPILSVDRIKPVEEKLESAKWKRWVCSMGQVLLCCLLILACMHFGKPMMKRSDLHEAQNLYKIPQEVIDITELIHEDEAKMRECGRFTDKTILRVMVNEPLMVTMRQYDPSIRMGVNRDVYLGKMEASADDDAVLFVVNQLRIMNKDDFKAAIERKRINYIATYCNDDIHAYLTDCSYTRIGTVGLYMIFRVE